MDANGACAPVQEQNSCVCTCVRVCTCTNTSFEVCPDVQSYILATTHSRAVSSSCVSRRSFMRTVVVLKLPMHSYRHVCKHQGLSTCKDGTVMRRVCVLMKILTCLHYGDHSYLIRVYCLRCQVNQRAVLHPRLVFSASFSYCGRVLCGSRRVSVRAHLPKYVLTCCLR